MDSDQARALASFELVEFVEDFDRWHRLSANLGEHTADGGHVRVAVWTRRVDDVDKEIGGSYFFQRRPKCGDERVRKPIDEADGVRYEQLAPVRQADFPHERVQRHEKRVRRDSLIA